jgi:hypothetical protein
MLPFPSVKRAFIVRSFLLSLLAVALFVPAGHAATFVVPPDSWMVDDARTIATGTVLQSFARLTDRGEIETVYVLSVHEVLKGTLAASTIELVQFGGEIGDRWDAMSGAPRYEAGKRYLVFLDRDRKGQWTTRDLTLGRFEFARGTDGELLLREGDDIHGWDIDGKPAVEPKRYAAAFVDFVRARAGGQQPAANYFVDGKTRAERPRGRVVVEGAVETTDFAGYDFDDASNVGVDKWTNDSGSNVDYSISNTPATSNVKDVFDEEDKIIEEDPNGDISGTFNGSGIVATAFYGGGGTHEFEAKTYKTITAADVITQNGVKDSSLGQSKFRTTLVHEIGHTLGFRHSNQGSDNTGSCAAPLPCTSSAVMNSSVSAINGVLQAWDQDAVRAMYGSGGEATDYATCANGSCTQYWRRETPEDVFRLAKLGCVPPSIATQPQNKTIAAGGTTSISVVAGGSGPFTYQWYIGTSGDTSTPTGTNAATLSNLSPARTTSYWVRVTGQCGSPADSNTATVTVQDCTPASISSQPPNKTIVAGSTTSLSVTAGGTSPFTYQWYLGTTGDTSTPIGNNSSTLAGLSPSSTTSYWVRVTGACGAALNSNTATITVNAACANVIIQSATATTGTGGQITLTANAVGGSGITYTWFRGATPGVDGTQVGTGSPFTTLITETTTFWVRARNSCGNSSVSDLVPASPCGLPSIVTQPADVTINSGARANLTIVLGGPGSTVEWFAGAPPNKAVSVGTGETVSVGPLTVASTFWAAVKNSCGEIASRTVTVTISECLPPAITVQPATSGITAGQPVSLAVVATGTATLAYQWYLGESGDTSVPVGTNAPAFTSDPLLRDAKFWVRVTNGCGSSDSVAVIVRVSPTRRHAVRSS